MDRFSLHRTADGSLTVFDAEAGECFKSRHAAKSEAEHVFYGPGVLENPHYQPEKNGAPPFRVLELGFGLGTNFQHFRERGFRGEFLSLERDLSGARFYLREEADPALASLVEKKAVKFGEMSASILEESFEHALPRLQAEGYRAHAILFDPFSPKANPQCWTEPFFAQVAALLVPGGRLVTYSVSRAAKDGATRAGLLVEKRDLPPELKKRSALLATKPAGG